MAVVSIDELKRRGGDIQGFESTARRTWRVEVDGQSDDQYSIYAAGVLSGDFPDYLTPWPTNALLTCRNVNIEEEDDKRFYWLAVATYSAAPLSKDQREREEIENPLLRPAKISWSTVSYTRPVVKDRDGNAILNSAGDYYDPPPEIDDANWVIHVRKNVAPPLPTTLLEYKMAVNEDPFTIGGIQVLAEHGRVAELAISELQEENGVEFHVLEYAIETNPDGFDLSLLDQGLRKKVDGELVDITIEDDDGNSERVSAPVMLDGAGGELANPTPATAKYNDHKVSRLKQFSGVLPLS